MVWFMIVLSDYIVLSDGACVWQIPLHNKLIKGHFCVSLNALLKIKMQVHLFKIHRICEISSETLTRGQSCRSEVFSWSSDFLMVVPMFLIVKKTIRENTIRNVQIPSDASDTIRICFYYQKQYHQVLGILSDYENTIRKIPSERALTIKLR